MLTPEEILNLKPLLLSFIPDDGSVIGNTTLRILFIDRVKREDNIDLHDDDYWTLRNELLQEGKIKKGLVMGVSVTKIQISSKPPVVPTKFSK